MTDDQSFADIVMLLDLFTATKASAAYRCADGTVQLRFRCGSFDSLKEIVDCAVGANAKVEVEPAHIVFSNESEPSELLCFTITIDDDWTEHAPPSQSQMIGVFLARTLRKLELITAQKSSELHQHWNAEPM